uniref:ITPR-interacting domain-containing protein n=1 Tax=Cyclopterus lumpus TaxID=8103 RepID=A0A8C2Z398_CYCLU
MHTSVSEILQLCSEDAEETLYELGFGRDEPQVTVRIPPRFFTFPSLSQGINFRLFLDSQLRRIREEDHSLTLASRFRQVQVLTAMANAFYSLYSHVSRTPLQKLAPPECTFSSSSVERIERFRSNIRSEPRSPVERLKDTVSKMCLYTGSLRGSDSTSPQPSPGKRPSLPDVVSIVLEKVKTGATKKLDLGVNDSKSAVDVRDKVKDEFD